MHTLRYDGTFEGFLTLLAYLFSKGEENVRVVNARLSPLDSDFFCQDVPTQPEVARGFFRHLRRLLPYSIFRKVFLYYLCDAAHLEVPFVRALKESLTRKDIWWDITNRAVMELYQAERKFRRERHRWLGLLRFAELPGGVLFAPFEPSYNVLPEIQSHFVRRFPNERFMIFDTLRKLLFMYRERRGELLWIEEFDFAVPRGVDPFAELWKVYFTEIAIPERKNPRRQQGRVPLRVRKFLPEFW
ncbi:MAG: TIGR03915 family putative DNA repair protein [Atribacterota bacterium]